jgi:cell division GTPase FtsZ
MESTIARFYAPFKPAATKYAMILSSGSPGVFGGIEGQYKDMMAFFGSEDLGIKEIVGDDTNVIFGEVYDDSEPDTCSVTIIATGIKNSPDDVAVAGPAQGMRPQPQSGLGFLNMGQAARKPQAAAPAAQPAAQTRQPAYRPQTQQTAKPAAPAQGQQNMGYRSPKQNQTPDNGSSILIPEWISRQNNN